MEDAINWFKMTKYPRWVLSYNEGSTTVNTGFSTDGITHDVAVEELRNCLGYFPRNKGFKLVASPSKDNADAKKHLHYSSTKSDQPASGMGGTFNPSYGWHQPPAAAVSTSKEEIAQMIKDAVEKDRLNEDNKRLKDELARLKGEKPQTATDAAISQFISGLTPYLPYYMFDGKPPAIPVAGPRVVHSEEETTQMAAKAIDKIRIACESQGIDLADMLVKMAAKAEENPGNIHMLNQLLG